MVGPTSTGTRLDPGAPIRVGRPGDLPLGIVGIDLATLGKPIIVTIDGPAGTGKSTVAQRVAHRLGLDFLDTGAMYRAAALVFLESSLPREAEDEIVRRVHDADVHFDWTQTPPTIMAGGRAVHEDIRTPRVDAVVSSVAGIKSLRRVMVEKQRLIGRQHPRLVTEGRDQGSVVFPDAAVRIFLTARPAIRARRRAEQLRREKGLSIDVAEIEREIIRRDASDHDREVGPLMTDDEAKDRGFLVFDTSELDQEQVVTALADLVIARTKTL